MNESEGRKRLGAMVAEERARKFRTVTKAIGEARVSRGAWESVEAGRPVKPFTLAAIDDVFGWPTGRAQRVIDGTDDVGDDVDYEAAVRDSNMSDRVKAYMLRVLAADRADRDTSDERGTA